MQISFEKDISGLARVHPYAAVSMRLGACAGADARTTAGLEAGATPALRSEDNFRLAADGEDGDVVFLAKGLGGIGEIIRRLVAEITHAIEAE